MTNRITIDGAHVLSVIVSDITEGDRAFASILLDAALLAAKEAVHAAGLTSFTAPEFVRTEYHLLDGVWVRMARFDVEAR